MSPSNSQDLGKNRPGSAGKAEADVQSSLTGPGKLFLGLAALLYLASITSQSGLLLFFIGLIGGCVGVNWRQARRSVRAVQVSAPSEVIFPEGTRARVGWQISNSSERTLEMIEIQSSAGILFQIPQLSPLDTISRPPDLVYEKRGVYPNAAVEIQSSAPYGLIRTRRVAGVAGEVLVVPRIYETASPSSWGFDQAAGGKHRGGRRVSSGQHFAGVRQWQPGDLFRQVHWKSTAQRGELMVKTFEEELSGRISVILDCRRGESEAVENAVRAAASVSASILAEGQHLEFCWSAKEEMLRFAPYSDEAELLRMLAWFEPEANPPEMTRLWRKSAVALFGTEWLAEWNGFVEEAERQGRPVHIYLPNGAACPARGVSLHYFTATESWPVEAAAQP